MAINKTYYEKDEFFKKYDWHNNQYYKGMPMDLIENYIYLYHLDQYIILPSYPDNISDTQSPKWSSSSPLLRTAPIQSYTGNSERKISCKFDLHRDLFNDVNATNSSGIINQAGFTSDEDYTDKAIKLLLAAQLPRYSSEERQVNPPIVAMRLGDEIYIKGVLTGIGTNLKLPMLRNGKYASIEVSIDVTETEPFDAEEIMEMGSYRLRNTLSRNTYSTKPIISNSQFHSFSNSTVSDEVYGPQPRNFSGGGRHF